MKIDEKLKKYTIFKIKNLVVNIKSGAVSVLLFIGMPSVHSRQIKKCKVNDFLKKVNLKVVYIKKKL